MGEITDMIMEGILCDVCGVIMDDVTEDSEAPGYPRTCADCENED